MTAEQPQRTDQHAVRRAYDALAEDYATYLPDTRAEAPADLAMVDAFADAVRSHRAGHALDAGCGTGRMSRHLARRGCSVEGLDLSPSMIAMARRDHPDLMFTVGSLTELPFPDDRFAGVMLWYSIIHTPPAGLGRVIAESTRVLRPGGHLLVAFQAGHGVRDVSATYRRYGHEVRLDRHLHRPEEIAAALRTVGLHEITRLVRPAEGTETEDQAVLLARLG